MPRQRVRNCTNLSKRLVMNICTIVKICCHQAYAALAWACHLVIDSRQRVVIRKDYRETLPCWLCWSSTTSHCNHFVPQGGNLTLVGKMNVAEGAVMYNPTKCNEMYLLWNEKQQRNVFTLIWNVTQCNVFAWTGRHATARAQARCWVKIQNWRKNLWNGIVQLCGRRNNAIEDINVRGAHIEATGKYKRGIFAKWSRTQNIQDMHPLDWPCNHHHGQ